MKTNILLLDHMMTEHLQSFPPCLGHEQLCESAQLFVSLLCSHYHNCLRNHSFECGKNTHDFITSQILR